MKLSKKKILNINILKPLVVSFITFIIRYFYVNVYLGFYNNQVTIAQGVRSQIYFGGILIDYSFDIISLSFYVILFILEICYLTMDLFNETNDNLIILLARYKKNNVIYKEMLIKVLIRNCVLLLTNYIMFVLVERTSNWGQDIKIIFMLLIEIFSLQIVSYLFSFWKDSIIGYIVAFSIFFIPIMMCGFYYSIVNNIWRMGHYSMLHIPIFNWHNKLILYYVEENYEWTTSSIDLLDFKICCIISIILSIILIWIGKILCDKKQVL